MRKKTRKTWTAEPENEEEVEIDEDGKRAKNWNQDEKKALMQAVLERKRYVHGRLPMGITTKDRSDKWDEITDLVNNTHYPPGDYSFRTKERVMTKVSYILTDVRKKYALIQEDIHATGGGPPSNVEMDPSEIIGMELLGPSVLKGIENAAKNPQKKLREVLKRAKDRRLRLSTGRKLRNTTIPPPDIPYPHNKRHSTSDTNKENEPKKKRQPSCTAVSNVKVPNPIPPQGVIIPLHSLNATEESQPDSLLEDSNIIPPTYPVNLRLSWRDDNMETINVDAEEEIETQEENAQQVDDSAFFDLSQLNTTDKDEKEEDDDSLPEVYNPDASQPLIPTKELVSLNIPVEKGAPENEPDKRSVAPPPGSRNVYNSRLISTPTEKKDLPKSSTSTTPDMDKELLQTQNVLCENLISINENTQKIASACTRIADYQHSATKYWKWVAAYVKHKFVEDDSQEETQQIKEEQNSDIVIIEDDEELQAGTGGCSGAGKSPS